MNPSTSSSISIEIEPPKPISSPRRTLPEAPPSYYDFPPSYTTTGDTFTDELPAYCPREYPPRPCPPATDPAPNTTRVYTVMPRQTYAIRMNRIPRRRVVAAPPRNQYLRRKLNRIFGMAFIFILAIVILILAVLMTISLASSM
ncbi:unnamed protein product [Caenorhabditis brenneri]